MNHTYQTQSAEETEQLGETIAQQIKPGDVIAFTGDLGAGKTAFCRGMLRGFGYHGRVTSPTFTIVNEYETERGRICHFDMYRILDEDALYDIGWEDYLDGEAILLIEWSENIADALPPETITIDIRHGASENERCIIITGGSAS